MDMHFFFSKKRISLLILGNSRALIFLLELVRNCLQSFFIFLNFKVKKPNTLFIHCIGVLKILFVYLYIYLYLFIYEMKKRERLFYIYTLSSIQ